jgi:Tfp pilus assembly PilM family ATPase
VRRGGLTVFGEYVAGLSYAGETLRTVILKLKNGGPVLCSLSEEKISDRSGAWFLRSLTDRRTRFLKKLRAVSVGVDNGSVLYHSFPLDVSEGAIDRNEQTDWELANFIGGYLPAEFIKDVRVLSSDTRLKTQDVLVVAANRGFVREIQSAVQEKNLRLQVIETNFFGASYALSANYPEAEMKRVLLATLDADRADAGVFNRGKLEMHRCANVGTQEEVIGLLRAMTDAREVDAIFLSGAGATHSLALAAKQQLGRGVELLNPIRRMKMKRRLARNNEFAGLEHRFASVIGCALRKQ